MPPHSPDGQLVSAAHRALEAANVDLILPFIHPDGEAEVRAMFDVVMPVRGFGAEAREVADRLFLETVARVHRAGPVAPREGVRDGSPRRRSWQYSPGADYLVLADPEGNRFCVVHA
jgi:hypothetical protein